MTEWTPELAALVEWFRSALAEEALPFGAFPLRPGVRVCEPETWYANLLRDLGEGPSGPRVAYGVLEGDLCDLRALCEGE